MKNLYYGRGNGIDREELLDFLNLVFGFNGYDHGFMHILPNLYKEEYDPAGHNYVVLEEENGKQKLRAAVGVYPRTISVHGETLVTHGIGNVAVHPNARSKGYMRRLMHMALDDMIAAGADFSDLGGLRHRYQYYGYEKVGCEVVFHVTRTNIRHMFPDAAAPAVYFKNVAATDTALLDAIHALYEAKPYHTIRSRESLADTLKAGEGLQAIFRQSDDSFCGFFIGGLDNFTLADESLFLDTIRAWLLHHDSVDITLQPYETGMIEALYPVCESFRPTTCLQIAVFRFQRLLSALLHLKAATEGLVDGVRVYRIDGIPAGNGTTKEEIITISVVNGIPDVQNGAADGVEVRSLSYLDAVACYFALVSPARQKDPLASQWFPLPVHMDGFDHV